MKKLMVPLASGLLLLFSSPVFPQDVMQLGLKHWTVLAENDQVRVLRYAAAKGVKTPMHSHPTTVVYIAKGGKIRIALLDGTVKDKEYASGVAFTRAAETHSDEALDDLEFILVELKR